MLGSLVRPIINNTITKTFVFCSILSFEVNVKCYKGKGRGGEGGGGPAQVWGSDGLLL